MRTHKPRYTDAQIENMLLKGYKSRQLRAIGISPKRIARISRGEKGNPPGHPQKFNDDHRSFITDLVMARPSITATEIQNIFKNKFGQNISTSTISVILNNNKFFYGPPIKIQELKDYQIVERYNFCKENLMSNDTFFETILFSDECKFANNPDSIRIYRKKGNYGSQFCASFEKFPISCLAWGCIGINFKSELYFFDTSVNSEVYIKMLKSSKFFENAQFRFKNSEFYFQQDGAKCHIKEDVLSFIFQRCNLLCGWPANSPDLSPIEMMWSIIKNRISKYTIDQKPKTKVELIKCIKKEWDAIDISIVNNLVLSFKNRLKMCFQVGGKTIVPYLKKRQYEIPKSDQFIIEPFTFNDEIDNVLIQLQRQSWKKTGEQLQISPNLVKYRTNFLIQKKQNDETPKKLLVELNENNVRRISYVLPDIDYISNMTLTELDAIDHFPPVNYDTDDSNDSDINSDFYE